MPLNNFSAVFLPYCLKKQPDGRYAVLNREYKPVGFFTKATVEYAKYPVLVKLPGLKAATAARLSAYGDPNIERIFLYKSNRSLILRPAAMREYMDRLEILARYKVPGEPAAADTL